MERIDMINLCIRLCCFVGFCLSYYSYIVEIRLEHDTTYSPMCDISSHMSCSVAFLSEYGKGFGMAEKYLGKDSFLNQPNGIFGCIFYFLSLILSFYDNPLINRMVFGITVLSIISSVYLAFILSFILYDACVVCITSYFVNASLLVLSYKKMRKDSVKTTKIN